MHGVSAFITKGFISYNILSVYSVIDDLQEATCRDTIQILKENCD
jgi:hypothetical protein